MDRSELVLLAGFVEGSHDVLTPDYFVGLAAGIHDESWPIDPPRAADPPEAGIGVLLDILAVPDLPGVERVNLEAASRLLDHLAEATRDNDAVVAVEYHNEVIGWIQNGHIDDSLSIGFLGEWRKRLGA